MKNWSEKTVLEKVSDIISGIAFCVWMIFEAMEKRGVAGWTDIASRIAVIVICIFEGISHWNDKRILSYVAIGGMICIIATFVLEFVLLAN